MTDFTRPVHCLLGLPFDALDMGQAARRLEHARAERTRCLLSTPNLNYLNVAQHDRVFRDSVCRSDISVADGMPLIWISRLLGVPLRERVSGSGLFDALRRQSPNAWKVFFFGGPQGAGSRACEMLAADASAMRGAGHRYPGFGSVQQMSGDEWIDHINASGADFLVVSLGSAKGQAWISHNLDRLRTPVVSHLGAGGSRKSPHCGVAMPPTDLVC
jgi:N-acetylglucosaminyldiphosphoundecaprenol N-acetyl-beta-D-mannosaminyltransferase